MPSQPGDYRSNVRWFLEKPWHGNSPSGSVRAQLGSLQASLMRLYEDSVASQNDELKRLGRSLLAEYQTAFQDDSSVPLFSLATTLEQMQIAVFREDRPEQFELVVASLKQAVLQLIDFAVARRDEQLGNQVLELARKLVPVEAATGA